jgi:hypothetical protein
MGSGSIDFVLEPPDNGQETSGSGLITRNTYFWEYYGNICAEFERGAFTSNLQILVGLQSKDAYSSRSLYFDSNIPVGGTLKQTNKTTT